MKSTLPQILGALSIALAAACDPPPKPPAAPPKAEPTPPPPKCEALSEDCLAKDATTANLPGLAWTLTPPKGWRYAQEKDFTVFDRSSEKGAFLAATTVDTQKNLALLKKTRVDAIEVLARRGNVKLKQRDVVAFHLANGPDKLDIAGMKLSIWEQEGAHRGDPKAGPPVPGNVVVVCGTVDGRELVMLGFAPEAPATGGKGKELPESDTLVTALQSLAKKKAEGGKP